MADLDLNRISASQLEKLPGIGRPIAKAIVEDRAANGPFRTLDDVRRVRGVDDRIVEALHKAGVAVIAPPGPAPYELTVIVQTGKDEQPAAEHRIVAGYAVAPPPPEGGEAAPAAEAETVAVTGADGQAQLRLPPREQIASDVTLIVFRPTGLEGARRTLRQRDLPAQVRVELAGAPDLVPGGAEDPTFGKPARLRGRVIDQRGERQVSGAQVILFGQPDEEEDALPLGVARTDSSGYFSADYPIGTFAAAHAVVSVNGAVTLPIHLADGAFPERVLLVIDGVNQPGAGDDACDCDGGDTPRDPDAADLASSSAFSADVGQGRCVDFTRPDRTLQEFRYYYLVRTTEPNIRGFTVAPPPQGSLTHGQLGLVLKDPAHLAVRDEFRPLGDTLAAAPAAAAAEVAAIKFDAATLRKSTRLEAGLSLATVADMQVASARADLTRVLGALAGLAPGRTALSGRNSIDWDDDPTTFEATTVAHGHILNFRQEWIADGYSMGKLLYSLPLAPGQKKQIAVVDWERQEQAARTEESVASDSLLASLARDRDLGEIVHSTLTESMRGGSESSNGGVSAGLGLGFVGAGFGGLLGISGGTASADSSAWQDSSRSVAADSLQSLRDRTAQSASSLRAQRSTVVQSMAQGERTTVTTETVANYNHCHAITIEYFEVLRHLICRQRLTDVQECLFVPLQMSPFDRAKTMRWRNTLRGAVTDRKLRQGFDAIERIMANYEGADLPLGAYADDRIDDISGELRLRFQLARPRDKEDGNFDPPQWGWMGFFLPFISAADWYQTYLKNQALKDRIFEEQLCPQIAQRFADVLVIKAELNDGSQIILNTDCTLVSNFRNDTPLTVTVRLSGPLPPISRRQIRALIVSDVSALVNLPFSMLLPANSRVIVESATIAYRTPHMSGALVRDTRVLNDLVASDAARMDTSYLSRDELRNPREEDKELARRLIDHLNENIEDAHHAIWARMSPDRRFMLLDGFTAPNAGGRSIASVVENRLVGIVGNCLVLPVARGNHLDPTFKQEGDEPADLLAHYQPNTPIEPLRVAFPTRGVYAEAVMGACNSCERKEEDRYWRWEESPIPDSPAAILPVSTDSRRADPPDLTAKDFAQPIIAMQAAPAAPDPTGLAAAFQLLGKGDSFRDITGLAGTQANAAAALKQAFESARAFGEAAGNLALQGKMSKDVDRTVRQIEQAKDKGLIDSTDAAALTKQAITAAIGGGATPAKAETTPDQLTDLTRTAGANQAKISVQKPGGEAVEVDARPTGAQDNASPRPLIVLPATTTDKEARCFNPAASDRSGKITLEAQVKNMPAGGSVKWSGDPKRIEIDGADGTVAVKARKAGLATATVVVKDGGGVQVASTTLKLSVPQFVAIDEDAAAFTAVLAGLKIAARKADVLVEARTVVGRLLKDANVRTVWQMAPFAEALPAGLPAANVTVATIRGEPPAALPTLFGQTAPPAGGGADAGNEVITLFPGAYDSPQDPASKTMVDVETQAILMQIANEAAPPALLLDFAVKVFGRLIGETLAHEIVHALLWEEIPGDGHNQPPIAGDLMNAGSDRDFRQRTGIEDTTHTSPVKPANFIDHGVAAIGGLQAVNQALIDAKLPVAVKLP